MLIRWAIQVAESLTSVHWLFIKQTSFIQYSCESLCHVLRWCVMLVVYFGLIRWRYGKSCLRCSSQWTFNWVSSVCSAMLYVWSFWNVLLYPIISVYCFHTYIHKVVYRAYVSVLCLSGILLWFCLCLFRNLAFCILSRQFHLLILDF